MNNIPKVLAAWIAPRTKYGAVHNATEHEHRLGNGESLYEAPCELFLELGILQQQRLLLLGQIHNSGLIVGNIRTHAF